MQRPGAELWRQARRLAGIGAFLGFLLVPLPAAAEPLGGEAAASLGLVVSLGVLSLAPFLFIALTSFAKISVVLGILRHGIGTPQIPSGAVVSALAVILTFYVMAPVWEEIDEEATPLLRAALGSDGGLGEEEASALIDLVDAAREPMRRFLDRHSSPRNVELFHSLASRGRGDEGPDEQAFSVLAPAFIVTELAEGFLIGFLLFVPFLVVDVVVANVLMSLGMHMLSPMAISLPLKLLLFVMVDGWRLVCFGLVSGYS